MATISRNKYHHATQQLFEQVEYECELSELCEFLLSKEERDRYIDLSFCSALLDDSFLQDFPFMVNLSWPKFWN
jgi:hypothetical protein